MHSGADALEQSQQAMGLRLLGDIGLCVGVDPGPLRNRRVDLTQAFTNTFLR